MTKQRYSVISAKGSAAAFGDVVNDWAALGYRLLEINRDESKDGRVWYWGVMELDE